MWYVRAPGSSGCWLPARCLEVYLVTHLSVLPIFFLFLGFFSVFSVLDSSPNSGKRYFGRVQSWQTTQASWWSAQIFECLTAPRHPTREDFSCSVRSRCNIGDHYILLLVNVTDFWIVLHLLDAPERNMEHMRLQLLLCWPCEGELHKPQGNQANLFVKWVVPPVLLTSKVNVVLIDSRLSPVPE